MFSPIHFFVVAVCLITCFYVFLIALYISGWLKLKAWKPVTTYIPKTPVTLIIPARNEANNIANCLNSVLAQRFPPELLEVVVVDDFSTDNTADIVETFAVHHPHIRLIRLQEVLTDSKPLNSYKKKAIQTAIGLSRNELIVTTDADCTALPEWLKTLTAFYEDLSPQLIAAPVCFSGEQSFFERFQTLDFIGMMVSTGASAHLGLGSMCNGANIAYTRQAFNAVNGFAGIDHLASGDDMLLMAKIQDAFPGRVLFLKNSDATVYTFPQTGIIAFANQRIRWASKSAQYQDKQMTLYLAFVFLFNASLLLNFGLWVSGYRLAGTLLAGQLAAKFLVDFIYLSIGAHFFNRSKLLWLFLPAQVLHIFYIVLIGILGNLGKYNWKGRVVR